MDYRALPFGNVWKDGIFNLPVSLVDKYLRITSEYQLKALLFIFRNGGQASSAQIAKALGQTSGDIDELMEFWLDEGVLCSADGEIVQAVPQPKTEEIKPQPKPVKETLSAPRLSPKDVVTLLRENERLQILLTESQRVLGRTISHAEQEMLINMVNYYGLNVEVVLMIMEFYRSEKQKGKSISLSYINSMAKNWADEGIESVADADEKLKAIEQSDRRWNEIISITGIKHKRPTQKQRDMVNEWFADFDLAMITLASDIMKENIPEPKLAYINTILKKWKKQDISSPAQVQAQQEEFEKQKAQKAQSDGKLKSKPTYNLDEIRRNAMDNTEI